MGRIPQLYILHLFKGKYQSGQMGQTVNLLAYAFGGSNPSLPTQKERRTGCLYFRVDREGETPCGAFLRK